MRACPFSRAGKAAACSFNDGRVAHAAIVSTISTADKNLKIRTWKPSSELVWLRSNALISRPRMSDRALSFFRQQVRAAGARGPVLPGAPGLRRVRLVAGVARRDLARRERLHLAQTQCRQQNTRIARDIHRHADHFDER